MTGIVKWFNANKGFGFITGDDGSDVFVHYSALAEKSEIGNRKSEISEGDQVSYKPVRREKGLCAENVVVTKPAPRRSVTAPVAFKSHLTRTPHPVDRW